MEELRVVFEYLDGQAVWWGIVLLGLSALVEYVFPPFPGDTVTLAGAVLIPTAGWPAWAVFLAVMTGTVLGAAVDWRVGVWIVDNEERDDWLHRWLRREHVSEQVEKLERQFRRHGPIYIALNRFVPAFRALFFIVAGMARLEVKQVLVWGAASAALWNTVILSAGYAVGYNIEDVARLFEQYSTIVWSLIGIAATVWIFVQVWNYYRDR